VVLRRTIVVHTKLAGYMARVHAARANDSGVQILTMGQLAARLAGGLLRPIDPQDLKTAVRDALAAVQLGELELIKTMPGMVRATVGTLEKVWSAGIDLSCQAHPRLTALHKPEQEVVRRLATAARPLVIQLHYLPYQPRSNAGYRTDEDQSAGRRVILVTVIEDQKVAALRDFSPVYVGSGSFFTVSPRLVHARLGSAAHSSARGIGYRIVIVERISGSNWCSYHRATTTAPQGEALLARLIKGPPCQRQG
jgi:hypothetical protein